jgi:hypothetical protein
MHSPFKPSRRPKAKAAPRPQHGNWLGSAYTVLLALMCASVGAQFVAASLAAMPPIVSVGDRIPFGVPARPFAVNLPVVAAAQIATPQSAPGHVCLLNLQKMMRPGGVFTVLAVRPDGVALSWAGGPTADASAACGNTSPVIVSENDYATLLNTQTAKH